MKNVFCLVFTAYCLLFFSCRQKTDYTKEISLLDSASFVLGNARNTLLSADTSLMRASYNSAAEKLHAISEKLSKDTVKKKTAIFLSDSFEQLGNILNLLDNRKYLEKAINESKQRIRDLTHDLNEDLIEKNKSGEYVVNEMNASEKISNTVKRSVEKANTSCVKLDSMKSQIAFFADSLNFLRMK